LKDCGLFPTTANINKLDDERERRRMKECGVRSGELPLHNYF
jgi:hypothetical protein